MTVYRSLSGRTVAAGAILKDGAGGEGEVRVIEGDPSAVVKLYTNPELRTTQQAKKLKAMLASPPVDPSAGSGSISIAWPTDAVVDASGAAVGYVMPYARGGVALHRRCSPKLRCVEEPGFSWRYLHRSARNLAAAVAAIHDVGHVIGDVNQGNALVNDRGLTTIIDTDSFQIRSKGGEVFGSLVAKWEYQPPEVQGVSLARCERLEVQDRFGLAVLIFLLLNENRHPYHGHYQGPGEQPATSVAIKKGWFYFARNSRIMAPPKNAVPFNAIAPRVQELFRKTFEAGHDDPRARASALEWVAALDEAETELIDCNVNKNHVFDAHYGRCLWCERAAATYGGVDPHFPPPTQPGRRSVVPVQKPLPPAPRQRVQAGPFYSPRSGASQGWYLPTPAATSPTQPTTTGIQPAATFVVLDDELRRFRVKVVAALALFGGSTAAGAGAFFASSSGMPGLADKSLLGSVQWVGLAVGVLVGIRVARSQDAGSGWGLGCVSFFAASIVWALVLYGTAAASPSASWAFSWAGLYGALGALAGRPLYLAWQAQKAPASLRRAAWTAAAILIGLVVLVLPTAALWSTVSAGRVAAQKNDEIRRAVAGSVWAGSVGNDQAVLEIRPDLSGILQYQGVQETLSLDVQDGNRILMKGRSYRRVSGSGSFSLDTFAGEFGGNLQTMNGAWSDASGRKGQWQLSRTLSRRPVPAAPMPAAAPPPALPYVEREAHPFEGVAYGEWLAQAPMTMLAAPAIGAQVIGTIQAGARFQAVTGETHTTQYGEFVVTAPRQLQARLPGRRGSGDLQSYGQGGAVTLSLGRGDRLYSVGCYGEGACRFWVRSQLYDFGIGDASQLGTWTRVERQMQRAWWVQVETDGRERGWVKDPQADWAPPPATSAQTPGSSVQLARGEPLGTEGSQNTGLLTVVVVPWANVFVDGQPVPSSALAKIRLSPGAHTVRLEHPDYQPWQRKVTIHAGDTFNLSIDLPEEGLRVKK